MCVEINDLEKRVENVKELISDLPSANRYLLEMLIAHLRKYGLFLPNTC